MTHALSTLPRTIAGLIALSASVSLALQFAAEWQEMGDTATTAGVLWSMVRYFTITTNAVVAVVFGLAAVSGRWPGAGWPAATTVWIIVVGVVYHVLLAATHEPAGYEIWSNIGFHTVVPLGVVTLWLASAPKDGLTWTGPVIWTAYPLAYAVYALLRGLADGKFPYFFLDPAKSGALGVAAYILGLGVFFVLTGSGLLALGRMRRLRLQSEVLR